MEEAQEQLENSKVPPQLRPWQFKPGQSGNPGGRTKGSISLKEYAKKYLMELDEEGKLKFMEGLNKDEIWRMSEGNPSSQTDITTKGEKINVVDAKAVELAKEYEEKLKKNI